MEYKPVLFAAMLKHHGQLGPAEIAGKREWTYRQVLWQAHVFGLPMQMPAQHPFNPLALLRLALASANRGVVNRYVCETIFEHVWNSGLDAQDAQRLAQLVQSLNPSQALDAESVKAQLKANTEEALSQGVFGVPTFIVEGKQFWGYDALPMLKAYLSGDAWFDAQWERAGQLPQGVTRKAAV
jgi:2-hydroxychromene-2-carboxylate isomerase